MGSEQATTGDRQRRVGVYPGSFNPPTVAHLAIAAAARDQRSLDQVVLMMSVTALAKERVTRPTVHERLAIVEASIEPFPWLSVRITEAQLLADIADGFDVLVMGADKWHQINELRWYSDEGERHAALLRLPELAISPRPPLSVPSEHELRIDEDHAHVSSSAARAGAHEQMTSAALASGLWTR